MTGAAPQARRFTPFIIGAALFMQTLDATVIANALRLRALKLEG